MPAAMRTDALDYDLPPDLIAAAPAEPRDSARLMVIRRDNGDVAHHHVRDLPDLGVLQPGDLMVVNQTRVLPAHFHATRADTGGRVSALFLQHDPQHRWTLLLESRGKPQPGERLTLDASASLELLKHTGPGEWLAQLHGPDDTFAVLQRVGQTPLPPYIRKQRKHLGQPEVTPEDAQRYNTVFARQPGSVAAPTAGLHFTPALLDRLDARGLRRAAVTLNVGVGTFAPVRTETLEDHDLHAEQIDVPPAAVDALRQARADQHRILAVGTTTVRALESLPDPIAPYAGPTRLFITPDTPFTFRFTDALLTNFHLPRSTLLALVAALPGVGVERLLDWYRFAVEQRYRFYSYGDAMLIV